MKDPVITKSELMALLDREKQDIKNMPRLPIGQENEFTFSLRKSHALGELRAIRGRILDYFNEREDED